jgi:hypothetical protein
MDFPLTFFPQDLYKFNKFHLVPNQIIPCSNVSSCFTWMKVHTRVGTSKWNDLTDLDEGVVSHMHVCKMWLKSQYVKHDHVKNE